MDSVDRKFSVPRSGTGLRSREELQASYMRRNGPASTLRLPPNLKGSEDAGPKSLANRPKGTPSFKARSSLQSIRKNADLLNSLNSMGTNANETNNSSGLTSESHTPDFQRTTTKEEGVIELSIRDLGDDEELSDSGSVESENMEADGIDIVTVVTGQEWYNSGLIDVGESNVEVPMEQVPSPPESKQNSSMGEQMKCPSCAEQAQRLEDLGAKVADLLHQRETLEDDLAKTKSKKAPSWRKIYNGGSRNSESKGGKPPISPRSRSNPSLQEDLQILREALTDMKSKLDDTRMERDQYKDLYRQHVQMLAGNPNSFQ